MKKLMKLASIIAGMIIIAAFLTACVTAHVNDDKDTDQTGQEPETKPGSESALETKPGSESETVSETKPGSVSEITSETKPEPESATAPETESETKSETVAAVTEPQPAVPAFQSFKLSMNYCSVEDYVYEAVVTESGIDLSYYVSYTDWSGEEKQETRQMVHMIHGDNALRDEVMAVLQESEVEKWDGFSESDPEVLDGESLSVTAVLADGTEIWAYGSNAYPDNFYTVYRYFDQKTRLGVVESTAFDFGCCTAELPESWIDKVNISYNPDSVVFSLPTNDSQTCYLCRIDLLSYEYTYNNDLELLLHVIKDEEDHGLEAESTDPESIDPESTDPENTKPENTDPENTKPENTEPESIDPEDGSIEDNDPEETFVYLYLYQQNETWLEKQMAEEDFRIFNEFITDHEAFIESFTVNDGYTVVE